MALRPSRLARSGGRIWVCAVLLATAGCAGTGDLPLETFPDGPLPKVEEIPPVLWAPSTAVEPAVQVVADPVPAAAGDAQAPEEAKPADRASRKAAARKAREETAARKAAEKKAKKDAAQVENREPKESVAEVLPPPAVAAPAASGGGYVLQPGDEVDVQIYREPELSGTFRINPAGDVRHSLLGSVPMAGKTVGEAEADLTRRLAKDYLVQPRVILKLTSTQSSQIVLLGEVKKPGVYPMPYGESRTLLQAIAEAGGFTELASPERIRILRRQADGQQTTLRIRMSDLLRGKGGKKDVPLEPSDVIMVDQVLF